VWQAAEERPLKQVVLAVLIISSVPVLSSLPFIVWNAEGFIKSIAFSATRIPEDQFGVPSFDARMHWVGIPAKVPMLVMLAAIYLLAWQRHVGMHMAVLLVMTTFTGFNSVLFRQYMLWQVPLLPLVAYEWVSNQKLGSSELAASSRQGEQSAG
jgi:hypothetical protein